MRNIDFKQSLVAIRRKRNILVEVGPGYADGVILSDKANLKQRGNMPKLSIAPLGLGCAV